MENLTEGQEDHYDLEKWAVRDCREWKHNQTLNSFKLTIILKLNTDT